MKNEFIWYEDSYVKNLYLKIRILTIACILFFTTTFFLYFVNIEIRSKTVQPQCIEITKSEPSLKTNKQLPFVDAKTDKYIKTYKQIALDNQEKYNIPASIILAQGILESSRGESNLAKASLNHFGIKCHSSWKGNKKWFYDESNLPIQCFRQYTSVEKSFEDHSLFLTRNKRYKKCFEKHCYKHWSTELKQAYYASNPHYDKDLIKIIEKYQLFLLDTVFDS